MAADTRLTDAIRWMWSLGDYTEIATWLEPVAERLADMLPIRAGTTVLDVAAGNGNFAITVARRGALVTATDLTPRMIELGSARSRALGVPMEWREADAEDLPYAAGTFDVVGSVFGAMFADPARATAELFRVTRPGGVVAMANYAPRGFLAGLGDILASFGPDPRGWSPFAWGEPAIASERLAPYATGVRCESHVGSFDFPSRVEALAFWERTNGPLIALRQMLPSAAYAEARRRIEELIAAGDRAAAGVRLEFEYLLVLATATR